MAIIICVMLIDNEYVTKRCEDHSNAVGKVVAERLRWGYVRWHS